METQGIFKKAVMLVEQSRSNVGGLVEHRILWTKCADDGEILDSILRVQDVMSKGKISNVIRWHLEIVRINDGVPPSKWVA